MEILKEYKPSGVHVTRRQLPRTVTMLCAVEVQKKANVLFAQILEKSSVNMKDFVKDTGDART
eukprot:4329261-Amphidinium_carterae.1